VRSASRPPLLGKIEQYNLRAEAASVLETFKRAMTTGDSCSFTTAARL
jgi:hypothetical protein